MLMKFTQINGDSAVCFKNVCHLSYGNNITAILDATGGKQQFRSFLSSYHYRYRSNKSVRDNNV